MKRIITLTLACIFLLTVQARAEITPQLLQEWGRQPNNVQWNLYNQRTNIQVVDQLPWASPNLYETYAYTTMNVIPGTTYVSSIDMYIKRGYESALTHEVGHALSNANHDVYWWCFQPAFIDIWNREKYNNPLLLGQGEYDIREYFACAYDLYIRFPQLLKQTCPDTFNYLTVVLKYT